MRYTKTINLWEFPNELVKYLQVGQWVQAGKSDNHKGRLCGVSEAGIVWVDWTHKPENFNRKINILKTTRK